MLAPMFCWCAHLNHLFGDGKDCLSDAQCLCDRKGTYGGQITESVYIKLYMNQESRGARQVHNKATPTRTTSFSKEKGAALGGTRTHGTLLPRQSALPTELYTSAGRTL